jgi:hypothetical protein
MEQSQEERVNRNAHQISDVYRSLNKVGINRVEILGTKADPGDEIVGRKMGDTIRIEIRNRRTEIGAGTLL